MKPEATGPEDRHGIVQQDRMERGASQELKEEET